MKTERGAAKFLIVSWVAAAVLMFGAASAQAELVAYWNFNEGGGATAGDLSPNHNDGTLAGGGGGGYGPPSWTAGHTGNAWDYAVQFKGGTDYVGVPDSASFDTITTAFTIALWAREDWGGEWQYLLKTYSGGNLYTDRPFYFQSDHGTSSGWVGSSTDGAWNEELGFNITDYEWHHYAFTYSGGTLTSFKDGVLQDTYTVGATFPDFTNSLRIGGSGAWTSFEGPIDDVVIFNTVEDIASIMDGTHPDMQEPEPPPPHTTPATYYVSQSSGNDTWNGLAPSWDGANGPWKTLARASTETYIPGDQILLKCGDTWNEELHPGGNGTPSNPVLIGSYGTGDKPVIDRLDYTQDRIGIHLADQEGFKIVGIEFNRCMTGIYAEYSNDCPTKEFLWIEDCYFHDSLTYGDYQNYPAPRNISLGICLFSYELENRIVLTDIMIKNCVFRRLASAVWTNSPDNFNKTASFIYNFGNMTMEDCLFEEGYQWQMGIRGVDGGLVRRCVTVDVGRGFTAWNGVAGAMFFRCKNWLFEDSEWGFISRGGGSGDGEAFDFEGNCDDNIMRNCLFHDTDGPGFLICVYASDGNYNMRNRLENCVHNGKAINPDYLGKYEILKTSDYCDVDWYDSRFYLSPGEGLMRVMDPETDKRTDFTDCVVKNLSDACSTLNLAPGATASASSQESGYEPAKAIDGDPDTAWKATASTDQWLELEFAVPMTINEFLINEDPSSSTNRYKIEYWDDADSQWRSCFNGYADASRPIGSAFVAPIVSRTTQKVRLTIRNTLSGNPAIREFAVYNDLVDPPAAPTVTWQDQGLNSGDTQKVTVSGAYPSGATQLKFFLDADGTTYTYGPVAETSHEFSNIGDSQTVYGYVQAYDDAGNSSAASAQTPCTIGDRTPPDTPAAPTVTWLDQGPGSGDTQKVTVSGAYPTGATKLKFFLDADGTTYAYGPVAETSHEFSNIGDNQTVYGYVRAYDDAGNYSADSAKTPCVIEDRNIPPTVSITSPSDGAIVAAGSNQVISATASDSDGSVTKVEFYRGGTTKIGEDAAAPYECTWNNVPLGTHTLTAVATDNEGATTTSDPVTVEARIPGDANGDGKIDPTDLATLLDNWNPVGTGASWEEGDFNGDGKVDPTDLADLLDHWDPIGTSAATPQTSVDPTDTTAVTQTSVSVSAEPGSGDSPRLIETSPLLGSRSSGLKALSLTFDRAVQIGANVAEVYGRSTGAHQDFTYRYDSATNTLYLEWPKALPPDIYDVRILADAVLGADGGAPLDGEIGDPADPDCLPSGDSTPGGDARFEFEISGVE